jgi:hypothetical protein
MIHGNAGDLRPGRFIQTPEQMRRDPDRMLAGRALLNMILDRLAAQVTA